MFLKIVVTLLLLVLMVGLGRVVAQDQAVINVDNAAQLALVQSIQGHTEEVSSLAFSPDGTYLVSGGWDRAVWRWDVANHQKTTLLPEATPGLILKVAFASDGRVAGGTPLGDMWIWQANTGDTLFAGRNLAAGTSMSAAFYLESDPPSIVFADAFGTIKLTTSSEIVLQNAHTSAVTAVAFSPDGLWLASGGSDGQGVKLWAVASGQLEKSFPLTTYINTIVFSPDGSRIAVGTGDPYESPSGTIHLFEVESENASGELSGHVGGVTSIAFHPTEPLLASGSADQTVQVWSLEDETSLVTLSGAGEWVRALAFSPDGTWLVSGSRNGQIQWWGLAAAQPTDTASDNTATNSNDVPPSESADRENEAAEVGDTLRSASVETDNEAAEAGRIFGMILGITLLALVGIVLYRRIKVS